MNTQNPTFFTGIHYFLRGFDVYKRKGLRRFAYLPLLINICIFSICFYFGFDYMQAKIASLMHWTLPEYLSFLQSTVDFIMAGLKYILIVVMGLSLLIAIGLSASLIANIIASPFNALLAERIDYRHTGFQAPHQSLLRVVIDSLWRELAKLSYTLPRLLGITLLFLLFYFVPGLNLVTSLLFSVFGAWMLAFEYLDYAADNRQIPIKRFKKILKSHTSVCYGFGAACMVFTSIPILNLIVIPVAVAGSSYLWTEVVIHKVGGDSGGGEITV